MDVVGHANGSSGQFLKLFTLFRLDFLIDGYYVLKNQLCSKYVAVEVQLQLT